MKTPSVAVRVVGKHTDHRVFRTVCKTCSSVIEYEEAAVRSLDYIACDRRMSDIGVSCPECGNYLWHKTSQLIPGCSEADYASLFSELAGKVRRWQRAAKATKATAATPSKWDAVDGEAAEAVADLMAAAVED